MTKQNQLEDIQLRVKTIFSEYLEKNGLRKTPERFSILKEIYQIDHHFDVESLFSLLKTKKYPISRATIYNTIEHLLNCNLIAKHQFGKNMAQFEKSFAFKQHDHLICQDCDKVLEFCDPRIQQIQSMMGEILGFQVTHHSLNLYGKCHNLTIKGDCVHMKKKNKVTLPKSSE